MTTASVSVCKWCQRPIFYNEIAGKWAHSDSKIAPCETRAEPAGHTPHAHFWVADPLPSFALRCRDCPEVIDPAPEVGYTDDPTEGFDACPEPTCSLYGKAVMADHRHLRPSHSADVPCRFCGAPQSECDMVWLMRDDSDRGCCDACNTRHEEKS